MELYRSTEILSLVVGNPEAEKTDYTAYRIPGVVVSKTGTVLIYWECRNYDKNRKGQPGVPSDECLMDLIVRRSTDGGKSFGESIFVARGEEFYRAGFGETIDNPVMFVGNDGRLHLLFCCDGGACGVWYSYSDDDGLTWTQPRNIVEFLSRHKWNKMGLGPGHGICLRHGDHVGRFIVSAWMWDEDHPAEPGAPFYTRVTTIYSDDNGETWQMGELASMNHDETCIAELSDGSVMLNSRQFSFPYCECDPPRTEEEAYRAVIVSRNGEDGWSETCFDKTLIDPSCEGSICSADLENFGHVLLFSNCASKLKRFDLTVRCSFDDGKTWMEDTLYLDHIGWYSDIAIDEKNGRVYVLHEDASITGGRKMCMELFVFSFYDQFGKKRKGEPI